MLYQNFLPLDYLLFVWDAAIIDQRAVTICCYFEICLYADSCSTVLFESRRGGQVIDLHFFPTRMITDSSTRTALQAEVLEE